MRHVLWAGLLGVAVVAGCGDLVSPGSERSELDANRQKWNAHAYVQYEFTLTMLCFCAINGPVRVAVRNDSIVSVTQISTGRSLDATYLPTINKLFDVVDRGISQGAATLRVTYDPTLGYPSEIVYDGSVMIADDEVTYTVRDVVASASPPSSAPFGISRSSAFRVLRHFASSGSLRS